jgi:dolichyl-phosphate-mannose-protein mannosyltransferase
VTTKRKKVRKNRPRSEPHEDSPIVDAESAAIALESAFVPGYSTRAIVAIALILFVAAHLALMIGLTTPDKITFDEVHYVPAAKQMLEHGTSGPILNPMHPPLAKQLMALSIRTFGDMPLGWRYPSVLFGSLAIVAMYLCGLLLFAAQGPAIATALLTFFNQMVFVQSRIAMLDIYTLTFDLAGIAAFLYGFGRQRPHLAFGLAGLAFGLATATKWSGLFPMAVCIAIVAVTGLLQVWRTQFAEASPDDWYRPDRWPDFRYSHFAACFVLIPAIAYFATFLPLYGFSVSDILEAQRRIFTENSSFHPPHPHMSSWPSWPLLMRPVWYQFDKIGGDRLEAIIFLGNPLILWPALAALGICLRDWIVTRRADAFLILAFYTGPWLAWAVLPRTIGFIYYYLPSATVATLALVYALTRGERPQPPWVLWAFVAAGFVGFVLLLPISASAIGASMETYYRLMIFKSWI